MKDIFRKLLSGSFYSLASGIGIRIVPVITTVILARFLSPAKLDIPYSLTHIRVIFDPLAQGKVPISLTKYIAEFKPKNICNHFLAISLIYMNILTILITHQIPIPLSFTIFIDAILAG